MVLQRLQKRQNYSKYTFVCRQKKMSVKSDLEQLDKVL